MSNADCAKFVDSLLRAVATKKNRLVTQYTDSATTKDGILAMFDAVRSQNGFTRTPPPGSAGYGNPIGRISKGMPKFLPWAVLAIPQFNLPAIKGAFHELMHMAGQKKDYSDRVFAEIVRQDIRISQSRFGLVANNTNTVKRQRKIRVTSAGVTIGTTDSLKVFLVFLEVEYVARVAERNRNVSGFDNKRDQGASGGLAWNSAIEINPS